MYKLVIADDESIIRRGLCNSINWNSLGFELVASFEDGTEVLEYIKSNQVDVILSDIVMCNVGGLDIAKVVHENSLPIKVVLMSGYQDFKYAHDAIHFQVFDYLLKPMANSEIVEKFKLLRVTLDKDLKIIENVDTNKIENIDNDKIAANDFVVNMQDLLIKNFWNQQQLDDSIVELIISTMNIKTPIEGHFVIFLLQYFNKKVGLEETISSHQNFLIDNGFFISIVDDEHVLGMFLSSEQVDDNEKLRTLLTNFSNEQSKFLFIKKKNISLKNYNKESNYLEKIEFVKKVVCLLQCYDRLESVPTCDLKWPKEMNSESKVQLLCLAIDVFFVSLYPFKISDKLIRPLIENIDMTAEIKDLLRTLYDKIVALLNGSYDKNYDFAIEKIKTYIKEHLCEDISVNALAGLVHLNPAYFGRYFKKVTFMTVKQYIYESRMELAIDLLSQKSYTVVEIAKMVGYDFKYFFPLFKKYTGYTPKEYLKYFIE